MIEEHRVKALKYLVACCCVCRRIRSDDGHYHEGEDLLSLVEPRGLVTHTICFDCLPKLYPEHAERLIHRYSPVAS